MFLREKGLKRMILKEKNQVVNDTTKFLYIFLHFRTFQAFLSQKKLSLRTSPPPASLVDMSAKNVSFLDGSPNLYHKIDKDV